VWISAVDGSGRGSPVLDQYEAILRELAEYRQAGGMSLLDCQPVGCGRDGNQLLALSRASGVNVIACTGFHRRKYYPRAFWLWQAKAEKAADFFCAELERGLEETRKAPAPVRAGFIKIALEADWAECPLATLEAAALAAARTGAVLAIHTERGALAERAVTYLTAKGVVARQLLLCHMDKRPDAALHRALVSMGVMLEYDTFYRPKYEPGAKLWPLLEVMVGSGHAEGIALATDMAEADLYHSIGGGPGLASLPGEIRRKLVEAGLTESQREQLLGGNIARRLAGLN
jgi:phosphotriesterase-related protein